MLGAYVSLEYPRVVAIGALSEMGPGIGQPGALHAVIIVCGIFVILGGVVSFFAIPDDEETAAEEPQV